MAYRVQFTRLADGDLKAARAYDQRRIVAAITRHLPVQPNVESRNRKRLDGIAAGFDFDPPLWELRIGKHRVFYDVSEADQCVTVRAIRYKRPEQTTQEIIS